MVSDICASGNNNVRQLSILLSANLTDQMYSSINTYFSNGCVMERMQLL